MDFQDRAIQEHKETLMKLKSEQQERAGIQDMLA